MQDLDKGLGTIFASAVEIVRCCSQRQAPFCVSADQGYGNPSRAGQLQDPDGSVSRYVGHNFSGASSGAWIRELGEVDSARPVKRARWKEHPARLVRARRDATHPQLVLYAAMPLDETAEAGAMEASERLGQKTSAADSTQARDETCRDSTTPGYLRQTQQDPVASLRCGVGENMPRVKPWSRKLQGCRVPHAGWLWVAG